jgi:cysteinyl-tRNA synthetase
MALDLIGRKWGIDVLDIHAGGVDLIFPHHEDEIAQSCAHTGREEFARVWMHGEFLTMGGTKMSKRFGNFLTARDLREEQVDPGTVRQLIFNTHYRQPLDWSDESLGHAREGSRRLGELRDRLQERAGGAEDPAFAPLAERFHADFAAALDDDLNSPRALAALFVFAREANRLLDDGRTPGAAALGVIALADQVLDVLPAGSSRVGMDGSADGRATASATMDVVLAETPPTDPKEADRWALAWANRRREAKAARDYAAADRIRDLVRAAGYEIRDGRELSEVVRR